MIRILVRLESLCIFVLTLYFYLFFGGQLLWYPLLFLIPDISMLPYLFEKRIGILTYNLVHNYVLGLGIGVFGYTTNNTFLILCGLLLISHVALDRLLGFGLKYFGSFKHTHIQRL